MRITDVSVVVHERKMPLGMPLPPMEMAVLRIHTDEGIEGNTFISPSGPDVTHQVLTQVKPLLLGRDPLDIGAIWHELWAKRRGMHSTVQGYIDVALWDIAGKAAGLPIHRLLGTVRHQVPAYISSWVHGDSATYAEEAAACMNQGFSAYKLHPPTQRRMLRDERGVTINDDIEACELLRDQVGSNYRLMLMATEMTEGGLYALPSWLVGEATDILRGDVVIKGGISTSTSAEAPGHRPDQVLVTTSIGI